MGDVIRRSDDSVPTRARRAGGGAVPPILLTVPGGPPPPAPPAAPPAGNIHNVVYVVAPPAAPAAPPVVTEVHHHHHHTTNVVLPQRRRRRPGKDTSFLGTLGLVVGGLGCGAACLPQVIGTARYLTLGGLGMAALAWVGAVLLRRVGTSMPFLGMLVSAAGYGLWIYHTGQAPATWDWLRSRSPVPLPAVRFDVPPKPGPVAPPPASSSTPPPPPLTATPTSPAPTAPARPPAKSPPTFFGM